MKEFIIYLLCSVLILLLIRLSWTDIKKRIISNRIVLFVLLIIIPLTWVKYEQIFLLSTLITFVIGFLLFTLNVMGGGDVKLISVLMLSIPRDQIFSFFFFTSFSGLLVIIIGWIFFRESIKHKGLPYGVAISVGYLINLVLFNIEILNKF